MSWISHLLLDEHKNIKTNFFGNYRNIETVNYTNEVTADDDFLLKQGVL